MRSQILLTVNNNTAVVWRMIFIILGRAFRPTLDSGNSQLWRVVNSKPCHTELHSRRSSFKNNILILTLKGTILRRSLKIQNTKH
jgi:hypothetical protein